jgi:CRP/FNR family cyclic AMP-dependent transcriptional regulator
MKKVLYVLGLLTDSDIAWFAHAGIKRTFPPGSDLIIEGKRSDVLFILTEGRATVSAHGKAFTHVGKGEIIGEIGMLDSRPPTATVTADTEVTCIEIDFNDLNAKLESDVGFGSRFYRALAVFLAQRMRRNVSQFVADKLTPLDEDVEEEDEIDPELLDEISLAGERFNWMLAQLNS